MKTQRTKQTERKWQTPLEWACELGVHLNTVYAILNGEYGHTIPYGYRATRVGRQWRIYRTSHV